MRVTALGLHHETNTFSSFATTYESFSKSSYGGLLRGPEIEAHQRSSHSTFAGYYQAADEFGFDLVPLLFAVNDPSGTITLDAFDRIVDEMMSLLREGGPWDGVLLNQMGAAVSEDFPDVDGEVAARTRAVVGPDIPVVMTLDLHANLSQKMVEHTQAIVVYRTNPHMDASERAIDACEILVRTIKGEIRPVTALEMPPMVISILRQDTREEPMRGVMADVEAANRRPGIIHTSMGQGYPWADVEEMGAAFYALADGDLHAARAAARWMAERAWARRAELATSSTFTPREALEHAMRAPRGPILLLDVGDNVGAGSAGDSTFILAEAQRLGVRSLLQTVRDPEAVEACVAAGVGSTVTLSLGGNTDALHGEPVIVAGYVSRVTRALTLVWTRKATACPSAAQTQLPATGSPGRSANCRLLPSVPTQRMRKCVPPVTCRWLTNSTPSAFDDQLTSSSRSPSLRLGSRWRGPSGPSRVSDPEPGQTSHCFKWKAGQAHQPAARSSGVQGAFASGGRCLTRFCSGARSHGTTKPTFATFAMTVSRNFKLSWARHRSHGFGLGAGS
jgi:microcystin degradation protein MlrC